MKKEPFVRRFDLTNKDSLNLLQISIEKFNDYTEFRLSICDGASVVCYVGHNLDLFKDKIEAMLTRLDELSVFLETVGEIPTTKVLQIDPTDSTTTATIGMLVMLEKSAVVLEVKDDYDTVRFTFTDIKSRCNSAVLDYVVFLNKLKQGLSDCRGLAVRTHKEK